MKNAIFGDFSHQKRKKDVFLKTYLCDNCYFRQISKSVINKKNADVKLNIVFFYFK